MVKACIFDLDGTLADTLTSISHSGNLALGAVGFPQLPRERYQYFAGDGAAELVRRALRESGDEKLEKFEEAFAAYQKFFGMYSRYEVKPYDGIVHTLTQLKERGIKLAVLSNKPDQGTQEVAAYLFPEGFFDLVQGQADILPKKPAPDGAWYIAGHLNVEKKECLYIGDTDTDMQTGKAAGMYTVGVTWDSVPGKNWRIMVPIGLLIGRKNYYYFCKSGIFLRRMA